MHFNIVKALWGDLEKTELKKFTMLAIGFFFLIGSFWPLKTLKDSIFITMVGPLHQPSAKLASLILFFPLIFIYSKLVDRFSKEKLIYFFTGLYGGIGLILVYCLANPTIGLQNTNIGPHRLVGWVFYLFVESYISLMLSLYWSFINDVATPESAKKGYGLILFGSQSGGLLFTFLGNYISSDTQHYAIKSPIIALISICMFFGVALAVFILQRTIGLENMQGYKAVNNTNNEKTVSFFDGLMLIINKPYVLAIFGIVFFQEFVSTIMSFQLQLLTTITYQDPGLVTKFLFDFALWVQIISCAFALFGTSFFQRKLGIEISLVAYPLLLGILIFIYILYPTLHSIFYVMLFAKALGYALNQPTKEALYIPTSKSIKYKSKAWIDMFGMRFAKSTGSGFNKLIGPALLFSNALTLGVIAIWIFFASALGKRFKKVITKNRLIE